MNDRKLLILFAVGLIVGGGALWALAFTVARPTQSARDVKASPQTTTESSVASPSTSTSSATEQTIVETPAVKLDRAKRMLTPPLDRDVIASAKRLVSYIPTTAPEHKEGQKLVREAEARLIADEAAEAVRVREMLQAEYRVILSDSNPHLNYITTKLSKQKDGFTLWGEHEYFGRYTFSIGGDGPTVSAWIDRNRNYLKKAGIVRVGVRSTEGWGGSCWFDI